MVTVHLSTKAAIFYPTRKIVNILNTRNSKKMLIVINIDSLRNISVRTIVIEITYTQNLEQRRVSNHQHSFL